MNKKTILIGFMILTMIGLAFAVPFSPQGNVDLKNYYNITNLASIGGFTMIGNLIMGGFHITGAGDINATNVNGNQSWEHQSYPAACSANYAITALGDSTTCTDSWVDASGDSMTGNLAMGNNNITGVNELSSTLVATTNLEADNLESNLDGTGYNLTINTLTVTDYGLVEDDIPTLSSTWDNSMDADRLTGLDYLNNGITLQGENITGGTVAEARLPTSIYTISLNGTKVDTGTVDEDYIEDKFLKNYGDTGTGDYSLHRLIVDLENNATNPTLAFGDGDTGFYEVADGTIGISLEGSRKWVVTGNEIRSNSATGISLINGAMTATIPGYAIQGDLTTGIGSAGNGYVSLIANATEAMRLSPVGGTLNGEFEVTGISGDGSGKAVCIKSDGDLGTCTDAVNATGYCTCT